MHDGGEWRHILREKMPFFAMFQKDYQFQFHFQFELCKLNAKRTLLPFSRFFRWVHPSLYEGVSVRRSDGGSDGWSVGP